MSEIGTIEGALYHNFQELDEDEIPTSACTKFDEGGSWEGYVLYGRLGEVDLTSYCGPEIHISEASPRGELWADRPCHEWMEVVSTLEY
jgi:hypothetical protein